MSTPNGANAEVDIHYYLGDRLPEVGSSIEVAPGVRWLRMRLPFTLDNINLWLLRYEVDGIAGWTIIDCGIANDETRAGSKYLQPNWMACQYCV